MSSDKSLLVDIPKTESNAIVGFISKIILILNGKNELYMH